MKLYFVRHGESEANLLREFSNRGLKHGLTDKGRTQAAELAQKLKETPVTKIFSSPLLRAVQTTEILAASLSKPYQLTGALREYDCGVLEGKSPISNLQFLNSLGGTSCYIQTPPSLCPTSVIYQKGLFMD